MESGIVGYQNIVMDAGWYTKTVTFKNISGNQIDLQDIGVVKPDGTEWAASGAAKNKCAGAIYIQKVDNEGNYEQKYSYWSTVGKWCIGTEDDSTIAENVKLNQGEAIVIHNNKLLALRFTGEVALDDGVVLPDNWTFAGNYIPCDIDIQDIKVLKPDGTEWAASGAAKNKCAGAIYIQSLDSEGNYGQKYSYWSTVGKWCVGTEDDTTVAPEKKIEAGEGFIVHCNKSVMIKISVNK